tara:strand:+ start:187 stop:513 length:327 start_codon:yes stop_codon:yes gene_type:complete
MNNIKLLKFFIIVLFLNSCGTLKEGFINQKKDNSDEFLVEKKMPLKMPPTFNELPTPSDDGVLPQNKNENDKIKSFITKTVDNNINQTQDEKINKSLKKTLLDKIKEN